MESIELSLLLNLQCFKSNTLFLRNRIIINKDNNRDIILIGIRKSINRSDMEWITEIPYKRFKDWRLVPLIEEYFLGRDFPTTKELK